MSADQTFVEFLKRLQHGCNVASQEVFDRYVTRLVGLAKQRLHSKIRSKVDPEDVAQSVFRSFFTRNSDDQFDFQDWGAIWSVLAVMTVRKCKRRFDELSAQRRDARRESDGVDQQLVLSDRQPTPDEAVMMTELLQSIMERLDERQREVLSRRLQGHTIPEISDSLEVSERTVHRQLGHIREVFESLA